MTKIRASEIRVSEIRVSKIRVSEIRISSNHRELHGAIFGDWRRLVDCSRSLRTTIDQNKSPSSIEDETQVDSTFLVNMNFNQDSLGLFAFIWVNDNAWVRNLSSSKFWVYESKKFIIWVGNFKLQHTKWVISQKMQIFYEGCILMKWSKLVAVGFVYIIFSFSKIYTWFQDQGLWAQDLSTFLWFLESVQNSWLFKI